MHDLDAFRGRYLHFATGVTLTRTLEDCKSILGFLMIWLDTVLYHRQEQVNIHEICFQSYLLYNVCV